MTISPDHKHCPRCEQMLPGHAFGWRDREQTRLQSYCRTCMRRAWREWYADDVNRTRHKAAVGRRRRRRIDRLRRLVRQRKSEPCADCGATFPSEVMDLDHVRGEKLGDISQMLYTHGEEAVLAELDKCQVVCANCHRLRTRRRRTEGLDDVG